jgi:hypothetical protein
LEGSFELGPYDFYVGADGEYKFLDSSAAITFETAPGNGTGVMKVNYCFGSGTSREMVSVQTGFEKGGVIPLTIRNYEAIETLDEIYNEYSFQGEYNCKSEELWVGFTAYFSGNAFGLSKAAVKDDHLVLNSFGCLGPEP